MAQKYFGYYSTSCFFSIFFSVQFHFKVKLHTNLTTVVNVFELNQLGASHLSHRFAFADIHHQWDFFGWFNLWESEPTVGLALQAPCGSAEVDIHHYNVYLSSFGFLLGRDTCTKWMSYLPFSFSGVVMQHSVTSKLEYGVAQRPFNNCDTLYCDSSCVNSGNHDWITQHYLT